jgi:hypothetical protein
MAPSAFLRRPRCLTTSALVLVVAATGCLSKPITKREAGAIVERSSAFTRPKFAHIPHQLTFQSYYSSDWGTEGVLSITDLAKVDPTVAILKLTRGVSVSENIYGPGRGAMHLLVINPTGIDSAALLADEDPRDGFDRQEMIDAQEERPVGYSLVSPNAFKRDLGWRVPMGTRQFVQVDQIHNWRDANENIPVNELAVDFSWRWVPNEFGDAFDSASETFRSLPDRVQEAAMQWGVRMNTEVTMHSRAYLRRDGGKWQLGLIQWTIGRGNPR